MNKFYLGQIFVDTYPPEAADWCNDGRNLYHIDEIERDPETGKRRFRIVENEPYVPEEEVSADVE